MSAGNFVIRNYKRDGVTGSQHPIRIQPETETLSLGGVANTAPTGTAILPSAQVSKGKRSIGINARTVTIKFAAGTEPDGYKPDSPIAVPWLQDNEAFLTAVPGVTAVQYQGVAAVLVGTSRENVR